MNASLALPYPRPSSSHLSADHSAPGYLAVFNPLRLRSWWSLRLHLVLALGHVLGLAFKNLGIDFNYHVFWLLS